MGYAKNANRAARKPRNPEKQHIPDIEGLNEKGRIKEEMRILGVIFDRQISHSFELFACRT
jgi:hypothetical protein